MPNVSKYPYIPKGYYPAVMFACKMIRENGYFNQAIERSARYYGVDERTLEKHVRARQAAGQKGKKRGKMRWFAVIRKGWRDGGIDVSGVVVEGLSVGTVTDRFRALDAEFNRSQGEVWMESEAFGPFDSEDEASRAIEEGLMPCQI